MITKALSEKSAQQAIVDAPTPTLSFSGGPHVHMQQHHYAPYGSLSVRIENIINISRIYRLQSH